MDRLRTLARKRGYRILAEHDGLYDLYDEESRMLWTDTPRDNLIEYLSDPVHDIPAQVAHNGLEPDRYNIIGCLKHRRENVILMQAKRRGEYLPYCIQYHGSGRYFFDFDSMATYAIIRFGSPHRLAERKYQALAAAHKQHLLTRAPIRWCDLHAEGIV